MEEKFDVLEQGGPEVMNEYQNYKIGSSSVSSKSSKRPSSVTASSRLLRSTQATKGKNHKNPGNYPFDQEDDGD